MSDHFREAALHIQKKLNTSSNFINALTKDNKVNYHAHKHCQRDLNNLVIPSSAELLEFAADALPTAATFFPSYQPTYSPALEELCKCVHGPLRPIEVSTMKTNTLFFYAVYHPRDISKLTIRKLHEKHCEKVFKEELRIDKFVVCYHRDKNLKESLSVSAHCEESPNASVDVFFKELNEN